MILRWRSVSCCTWKRRSCSGLNPKQLPYAIAQDMTQGTLPLIGYNYTSGNHKRMKSAIRMAFAYSFLVACAGAVLLWTLAAPIS